MKQLIKLNNKHFWNKLEGNQLLSMKLKSDNKTNQIWYNKITKKNDIYIILFYYLITNKLGGITISARLGQSISI